jgi:SulP family sulfate permease
MSLDINWTVLLRVMPEMVTCVIVGIISLIVKISSVEIGRSAAADIDQEFRANGAANLIAAPLGAMAGSVLVASSKAFMDAGARTQLSGIAAASITGLVVLAGVDLPSLVPTPVLAGFLLVMGYTMLTDALKGAARQKSWTELVLALSIALICLRFGFIIGVVAGFICACLIFALSYGRIGVVRRHLTRASFSGDVERAPEIERLLRQEGEAIHIYWLSGYIFFGSSEGLFERVRRTIDGAAAKPPRYIVLDLAGASGMDSSAIVSLVKLRNFCDKRGVVLVYAGLAAPLEQAVQRAGLLGAARRHGAFASRNEALDWCEEQLLAEAGSEVRRASAPDFEQWLARELGGELQLAIDYFERRECKDGDVLYRQGDLADTIDFIAAGTLAISIVDARGTPHRVRRSTRHTVLGEMGFFRGARRAATVSSEGPAVIHTLSRDNLERMRRERPELYEALLRFVIRTLSDRLELAHKEVAALT